MYVLVISHCKDDIVVITLDRGTAKVVWNNNDIIRVIGYNWLLSIFGNYIITFCLVNKYICDNYC